MIMDEIVNGMSVDRDENIQGLSLKALELLEVRQVRRRQRGQKEQSVK